MPNGPIGLQSAFVPFSRKNERINNQEKYEICVRSLKHFVEAAGFHEVVIGLSGGIDSALVAVMCADAFGAQAVHGVLLPGPYSSAHSLEDALLLARNAALETQTISIDEPYEVFMRLLSSASKEELSGLACENIQSRCRMICLMAFTNTYKWLMINTSNKSEIMMGYSTLYGDMAGAFAPLGSLYKTDVYELARWRNAQDIQKGITPVIPERIITKAPSAELSPDQEDERAMGIAYTQLDQILIALFEQGKTIEEVAAQGIPKEEVERIAATVKACAFKQRFEPPAPEGIFY